MEEKQCMQYSGNTTVASKNPVSLSDFQNYEINPAAPRVFRIFLREYSKKDLGN